MSVRIVCPPGYVLVPRAATEAMIEAGCSVALDTPEMQRASVAGTARARARIKMQIRWRAMIEVAAADLAG